MHHTDHTTEQHAAALVVPSVQAHVHVEISGSSSQPPPPGCASQHGWHSLAAVVDVSPVASPVSLEANDALVDPVAASDAPSPELELDPSASLESDAGDDVEGEPDPSEGGKGGSAGPGPESDDVADELSESPSDPDIACPALNVHPHTATLKTPA